MKSFAVLLTLSCIAVSLAAKTKISSLVPVCSRSDPNLDECVKKSANAIIPSLVKGIRDYGMPPIDPLKIPLMELSQQGTSSGLKLNITDSAHTGMADLKITDAKVDLKAGTLVVDLLFPTYIISGHCDMGGKILLLPITGSGPCVLSSYEMTGHLTFKGKPEKKQGTEYFIISKTTIDIKVVKAGFQLEGLFKGNKQLSDTMNRFLNENAVEVFTEMKGTLETAWADLFGGLVSRMLNHIPYDELFTA